MDRVATFQKHEANISGISPDKFSGHILIATAAPPVAPNLNFPLRTVLFLWSWIFAFLALLTFLPVFKTLFWVCQKFNFNYQNSRTKVMTPKRHEVSVIFSVSNCLNSFVLRQLHLSHQVQAISMQENGCKCINLPYRCFVFPSSILIILF